MPRFRRLVLPLLAALAAITSGAPRASADPAYERRDAPCPGCRLRVPPSAAGRAAPLVVALHGNFDTARSLASALGPAADAAGVVVASLACPADRGCKHQSWSRWRTSAAHDEGWLDAQLAAVRERVEVDPARVYAVGYSGGAYYLSAWLPAHPARFAGVGFVSGGSPLGGPCTEPPFAAYLLIGASDPLTRPRFDELHAELDGCGDRDVAFHVRRGVGHVSMLDAIRAREARPMLAWLLAHGRAAGGAAPRLPPGD